MPLLKQSNRQYDNLSASALDKGVTYAGEFLFERKPTRTLCNRIDLFISGQPGETETLNERQATIFQFQFYEARLEVSRQIDDDE